MTWKKVLTGIGIAVAAGVYFFVTCVAPARLDVRYCNDYLEVMRETDDLTGEVSPEQAEQLVRAVQGLARLNEGDVVFQGASAADRLLTDIQEVTSAGQTMTPDDALRISREADELTKACQADVA